MNNLNVTDFSLIKNESPSSVWRCGLRVWYVFPVVCSLFSHHGTGENDSIHRATGCASTRLLHRRQQAEGTSNPLPQLAAPQAEGTEISARAPSWLFPRARGWKVLIIAPFFLVITQFPVTWLYSTILIMKSMYSVSWHYLAIIYIASYHHSMFPYHWVSIILPQLKRLWLAIHWFLLTPKFNHA